MNNTAKKLLLLLFPFYPLWAWVFHFGTNKPMGMFVNIILLPIAINFLATSKMKLPNYLICFIAFTIYHLASSYINDTIPTTNNKLYWFLADTHVYACSFFIIIENVDFDEEFISVMNRNILILVGLSLIVSIIQTKDHMFFFNTAIDMTTVVSEGDIRIASLYSWAGINSGGITFPILIAILLNFFTIKSKAFPLVILSAIVVSFLTKARFVMISTIIAFSQLFFNSMLSFKKMISLLLIFGISVIVIIYAAGQFGFDINEVISSRIMEKDSEMLSAKARIISYEVFVKKFPESPILGVGPETKPDVAIMLGDIPLIHIGYLCYLYFYGSVGCFFLFLALFYLLRDSWKVGRRFGFWGSFYGILSFAVANITLVYFNFSEMGIVLAVIYVRFYKSNYFLVNSEGEIANSRS